MSLTLWVFILSGSALVIFTAFVAFIQTKGGGSAVRFFQKMSIPLEKKWTRSEELFVQVGSGIVEIFVSAMRWLFSHGIYSLLESIKKLFFRILRPLRSKKAITKRGAASLFLKQISEHKREQSGGSIEES